MISQEEYEIQRRNMVNNQLIARGVKDQDVLRVMNLLPRHIFVPDKFKAAAYEDGALGIGKGQTISQPYIVAHMTELLSLTGVETILEIGTGSGYQAAVLSHLAKKVYTIERHKSLSQQAENKLADLGIENVACIQGDGSGGWPSAAPYDGILVAAAAPKITQKLLTQLKEGGRLILPVGGPKGQHLVKIIRRGDDFETKDIFPVSFVPLRGEFGWGNIRWLERNNNNNEK
ncbi:MAG: protein-L-isoaspartate(D-aspartate) O-methyltransferase [Chloroflexota bacterium]